MSEHNVTLSWKKESEKFTYQTYNRSHVWRFDCGISVRASATANFLGDADCVDPEEAFVASLASCHMLTFLALAARSRLVVESYEDSAVGYLEKNAEGRQAITRVTLRPVIVFGGACAPGEEQLRNLHELAHKECFIANSVKTEVAVEAPR